MPIQVYLDSSDYSILSDPKSEDKKIEQTKAQLLSFLDRGVIEIRFSGIHILEMAHTSLKNRDLALKRFKVLEELCRNKALLYVSEMENIELATVAKGQINSLDVQTIANDEGKWCPDMIPQLGDLKKFIINELSKELKKIGLTRDQRKYFEKKLFKGGLLTDTGFDFVPQNRKGINDALSLKFPLTEKFWKEDLFLQYLRGTVKKTEILQEIQKGFIDPVNFIGWYINRDTKGLELPKNFRNDGEYIIDKIRTFNEKCQKMYDIGKQLQKSEKGD